MADLAEIKRRLALGRVTMDDAEALVAEVDRLRAAILGAEDSVVSPQLTGDEVLDDLERLEREATEAPWEADDDERPSV